MARFGNLTFQNAALSWVHVSCASPSPFTSLEIESVTVRIIRSLTWRWTIVHPACPLYPHGRAGRQGRHISLPPCRLHPLDRAMPFAVRLPWQGGALRASSYRGVASPACLRYCRRWCNVSLGHPLAHHSEGRQSRLTPYDAGLALRQSNARSISLIQCQNCKVLLKTYHS